MRIDFHINFSGNCREAFLFYRAIFGGDIDLLTYGESQSDIDIPEEWNEKIIHGSFKLNNLEIAGADVLPEQYKAPQGFHLLLQLKDESESKRIFHALSKGGSITMPLQPTFWSPYYGIVVDKFGISWEINCAPA